MYSFTRSGMSLVFILAWIAPATGQTEWEEDEIKDIFSGLNLDVSAAIARVEARGVTPYDFGVDLWEAGKVAEAKKWYAALGIATNDPQYVYGLATIKWKTGDNHGALKDGHYLLQKKISALLRARTLYLLGTINTDEKNFGRARLNLQGAFDTYASIEGKYGGQYLALSMLAWLAVVEGKYDEVEPLLIRALEYNEKLRTIGIEPYGLGRYHETLAELRFVQADYQGALEKTEESQAAYKETHRIYEVDMLASKIGLLKLLTGNPKESNEIASALWERFNNNPDREAMAAYNEITLMKLDQCTENKRDFKKREQAVREWAETSAGGRAILELKKFIMNKENIPCPEWR